MKKKISDVFEGENSSLKKAFDNAEAKFYDATKSKNAKLTQDFYSFCVDHPELRFWQALRVWAGVDKIYVARYDKQVDDEVVVDTYYWSLKNK